jgi:hypothetical protein
VLALTSTWGSANACRDTRSARRRGHADGVGFVLNVVFGGADGASRLGVLASAAFAVALEIAVKLVADSVAVPRKS